MGRLTYRDECGNVKIETDTDDARDWYKAIAEKLAEYEDAEEQGHIIVLKRDTAQVVKRNIDIVKDCLMDCASILNAIEFDLNMEDKDEQTNTVQNFRSGTRSEVCG